MSTCKLYTQQEVLKTLSPNLCVDHVKDCSRRILLSEFLGKGARALASQAQCSDLQHIWDAFGQYYAGKNKALTAETLSQLFNEASEFFNVVQLQKPIVYKINDSRVNLDLWLKEIYQNPFNINGAYVVGAINQDTRYMSNVGFITLSQKTTFFQKQKENAIIALPFLGVDERLLLNDYADEIIHPLQEIMMLANHDYYHQMTACVVNPYFQMNNYYKDILFAQAFGLSSFEAKGVSSGISLAINKMASRRCFTPNPSETDHYEYFANFMHSELYQHYLHQSPIGNKLMNCVETMFEHVHDMMCVYNEQGNHKRAQLSGFYFSTLVHGQLSRLVDIDHELMQTLYKSIDALPLDKEFCANQLKAKRATLIDRMLYLKDKPSNFVKVFVKDIYRNSLNYLHSKDQNAIQARREVLDISHDLFQAIEKDFKHVKKFQKHKL